MRRPRTGSFVPEGGIVRSGWRSVGDGAAQVGAPSVHQLLVAVGVGRCGGRLLLFSDPDMPGAQPVNDIKELYETFLCIIKSN